MSLQEEKATFTGRKQKTNYLVQLFLSILLGIIIGSAGLYLIPETTRLDICFIVLKPVYKSFIQICRVWGIPLIFLSVMMGIVGIGDIHKFSTSGSKMVKLYLKVLLSVTIASLFISQFFYLPDITRTKYNVNYADLVKLFLGAFPTGLLQPVIECNAINLVVVGVAFGISVLALGISNGVLCNCMKDLQKILLSISSWFSFTFPFIICIELVDNIWTSFNDDFVHIADTFVLTILLQFAFIFILVLVISAKYKVRINLIFKKIFKTFLIATATNSCSSSIEENYNCCGNKLGIDIKVSSYGIPFGTTLFKPATAIRLVTLCFLMAKEFGTNISFAWLITLAILAFAVSISIPAIPGGVAMLCSLMFASLNISPEAEAAIMTTDVLFDCFCTGFNQISIPLMLTLFAGSQNMLDVKKLENEYNNQKRNFQN